MHSPAGSLDVEDDGMMHQAIYNRGGDDGISEVIPEVFEVNICREEIADRVCGQFQPPSQAPRTSAAKPL